MSQNEHDPAHDSDAGSEAGSHEKLGPRGLTNDKGMFILQHGDMVSLVRYVWTGCLLPLNRNEYLKRLLIESKDIPQNFWKYIDNIIEAYNEIYTHNTAFRTNVYNRDLIDLANDIANFASTAGGGKKDSFTEGLMELGEKYVHAVNDPSTEQHKIDKLGNGIKEFTGNMKADVEALIARCDALIQALGKFQEECGRDQQMLSPANDGLNQALTEDGGLIHDYQEQIKRDQDELRADQAEYDHDMWKVNEAPRYMWVFPIGTIVGGAMIATYQARANKMAKKMDELNKKLKDENEKLQAAIRLVGELQMMHNFSQGVLDLIAPAIEVLSLLMTCWSTIKGDLEGMEKMVDAQKPTVNADSEFGKRARRKVRKAWNSLRKQVNAYRQVAFISNVEITTIEEAAKHYRGY